MRRMYSKKQIEKMALESSLEGFKSKDVVVKTIKQTEYNKSFDIQYNSPFTGATMEKIYSKAIVINNILYLVSMLKITNDSESVQTISSMSGNVLLDDETASKIFCVDGESLNEPFTTNKNIADIRSAWGNNLTNQGSRKIDKSAKNQFTFFTGITSSLAVGASDVIIARTFFVL